MEGSRSPMCPKYPSLPVFLSFSFLADCAFPLGVTFHETAALHLHNMSQHVLVSTSKDKSLLSRNLPHQIIERDRINCPVEETFQMTSIFLTSFNPFELEIKPQNKSQFQMRFKWKQSSNVTHVSWIRIRLCTDSLTFGSNVYRIS